MLLAAQPANLQRPTEPESMEILRRRVALEACSRYLYRMQLGGMLVLSGKSAAWRRRGDEPKPSSVAWRGNVGTTSVLQGTCSVLYPSPWKDGKPVEGGFSVSYSASWW